MAIHSFFGKESSDRLLEKVINKVINSYLKKVTKEQLSYNFKVKTKYVNNDLYSWVVEIHTDEPIPYTFTYNDEYKKKRNVDGFHYSVLVKEIKTLIESMGVVGNRNVGVFGIELMNKSR
jgi:hypothetical protein